MHLALKLGSLSGFNILLAFCYQWYILTTIGPGIQTDALFAGILIPEILVTILSGSLTYVLVPRFSVNSKYERQRESWNLIHIFGFLFIGIAIILYFTTFLWVSWIAPGFSIEAKTLSISIVNIQLIGLLFSAVNPILWSYYHASQKFVWVEMSQVIATLAGFFLLIWKLPEWGIMGAAWALVIRVAGQTFLLIPGLGTYRRPVLYMNTLKDIWVRLYPLILGAICFRTDQLVDRLLASMAPVGQLSLLYYARQIVSAGITILIKAIIQPIVPALSKSVHQETWLSFKKVIRHRTKWLLIVTISILLLLVVFGKPVLSILFGYGKFGSASLSTLHWLLIAMCGFWVGGTLVQIYSSGFYAKKDTKTPTLVGVAGFIIGIFLRVWGFYLWGIIGIAVGSSVHYLFNSLVLKWALNRQIQPLLNSEGRYDDSLALSKS